MKPEIFVFGSNSMGRHAGGAAAYAVEHHGAEMGIAVGLQGESYAIPTIGLAGMPLALPGIEQHVQAFLIFARTKLETLDFKVTRIGCGIAGYTDRDIAPFFRGAPENCIFPEEWQTILGLSDEQIFVWKPA